MKPTLPLVTAVWLASLAAQAQPTPSPASEPMMKWADCRDGRFADAKAKANSIKLQSNTPQ